MPLRAAFGAASQTAYSAVKLKDIVISLEASMTLWSPDKHENLKPIFGNKINSVMTA